MATPVSHGVLSELIMYSPLSPNVQLVTVVLLEAIGSRIMGDKIVYEGRVKNYVLMVRNFKLVLCEFIVNDDNVYTCSL